MSPWLLVLVTGCYAGIALDQLLNGDPRQAIVYAGYAAANVGLIAMLPPT